MSTYYSYYLGYQKDKKIYPLGPFNSFGELKPLISDSRSYASDLKDEFRYMNENQVTKELMDTFFHSDSGWYATAKEAVNYLRYLPFNDLPDGSCIKEGYFLIEEVEQYLEAKPCERDELIWERVFSERIARETFAARLQNELTFGKDPEEKSCRDYMYFAYSDTNCPEYDAEIIRNFALRFTEFDEEKYDKLVVLLEIS